MTALIAFFIIFAALGWIVAEFSEKSSRWLRLFLGVVTMVMVGWVTSLASSIIPGYESGFHREAMERLEKTLSAQEYVKAESAVERYNDIAASDSTYKAAMEMWRKVSQNDKIVEK